VALNLRELKLKDFALTALKSRWIRMYFLFHGTVAENIATGVFAPSEVIMAAKILPTTLSSAPQRLWTVWEARSRNCLVGSNGGLRSHAPF